jgi:hypothetical protein
MAIIRLPWNGRADGLRNADFFEVARCLSLLFLGIRDTFGGIEG